MIQKAIVVAALAHEGQVRKGTSIPYITHPYTVGMMLARSGCSDEVVAAGILHDTVEDTELTLEYIAREFGEKIAAIVEGCEQERIMGRAKASHSRLPAGSALGSARGIVCR
jgi:(p)ppGpp synthase/HD superfamily hydrolase